MTDVNWKAHNVCGVCWLGPCLCARQPVTDTTHKIIPRGVDDHIWNKTAGEVRASTVAFVNSMREEYNAGVARRAKNDVALPDDRIKRIIMPGDPEWYGKD